jgi:hypothetical protein
MPDLDTYGHLIPGANRAAADKLDNVPLQPAQPKPFQAINRDVRSSVE